MSYDATGSTTGKRNFVNNNLFNSEQKNDWSCAELPLTAAEHAEVLNSDGSAAASIHLPFVLGAISMFHSVPGVTGLKLSADNVAKIYQQEVK
jgi:ABC-type phosphate transport system substrate-binding protein